MKRGVSFQIPNEYGNYLWRILQPLDIANYIKQISTIPFSLNWKDGQSKSRHMKSLLAVIANLSF